MIPTDQLPPGADWIHRKLADLEREIRELKAARSLESSTIGAGGLTIKDGGGLRVVDQDGNVVALLGDLSEFGAGLRGIVLRRPGGARAFEVYGTGEGTDVGFVGIYDVSGNYVITDDVASGLGVARPYIPIPVTELSAPTATTTGGTFTDLAAGYTVLQHPVLYAALLVRASDGTTSGEARLAIDGTGIGSVVAIGTGAFAVVFMGPFLLPNSVRLPYGQVRSVSVQVRRTAGAGNVGVRPLSIVGLESAFAP